MRSVSLGSKSGMIVQRWYILIPNVDVDVAVAVYSVIVCVISSDIKYQISIRCVTE